MRLFHELKKDNGFSLVSTMVASGILAGMAVFLLQIGSNTSKTSKSAELSHNFVQAKGLVTSILQNEKACRYNLGKLDTSIASFNREGFEPDDNINIISQNGNSGGALFNSQGSTLWSIGSEIVAGWILDSIKIPSLNGKTPSSSNYSSIDSDLNLGVLDILVTIKKKNKSSFGAMTKSFRVPISVKVYDDQGAIGSSDLRIENCQSVTNSSLSPPSTQLSEQRNKNFCEEILNGTWDSNASPKCVTKIETNVQNTQVDVCRGQYFYLEAECPQGYNTVSYGHCYEHDCYDGNGNGCGLPSPGNLRPLGVRIEGTRVICTGYALSSGGSTRASYRALKLDSTGYALSSGGTCRSRKVTVGARCARENTSVVNN